MDEKRRRFLLAALSGGLLVGGLGWNRSALAELLGQVPRRLPEGRSVFRLIGDVEINGRPADRETLIGPEDHIRTGAGAELVAVVGSDAFILRENTELNLSLGDRAVQGLRLLTGALLTVFAERGDDSEVQVETVVAHIGVRGTGLYAESHPTRSYVCNCYGAIELAASDDRRHRESIVSRHHDAPRWVLAEPKNGQRIIPAPFINHSDMELILLEALVGRRVPFGAPGRVYQGGAGGYLE